VLIVVRGHAKDRSGRISATGWISILIAGVLIAPHLHSHDLTLLIVPAAFVLKRAGDAVPPLIPFALVVLGVLPLINSVAYPHLPPLLPIALLIFLATELRRGLI